MVVRVAAFALALTAVLSSLPVVSAQRAQVERLQSVRAVPSHLAGAFEEAAGFATQPSGVSLVFDRRRHAVFAIDRARTAMTRLVDIGFERGRLLRPIAFDVHRDGRFLVADAPGLRPRVSVFEPNGTLLNYFEVSGTARARVTIGNIVVNGIATARLLDDTILMNMPEHGGLVSEYSIAGTPLRTFGSLRATGHEQNQDVHLAMNAAVAVPSPDGHIYVVFLSGVPMFRKYTREGALVFERVVQSRQLDPHVLTIPTTWPLRTVDGLTFPFVTPVVRTAAVDRRGNLWIATLTSHVYVFDADGEKVGTYQLIGAGPLVPDSLWFTPEDRLLVSPGLYEFDVRSLTGPDAQ